jgi:uncharacterized membrane protein YeiB
MTGSIRVIFWSFVVLLVLIVLVPSLKPLWERRFMAGPKEVEPAPSEHSS